MQELGTTKLAVRLLASPAMFIILRLISNLSPTFMHYWINLGLQT